MVRKAPAMTFWIEGVVRAVAPRLVLGLRFDGRAGLACATKMGVRVGHQHAIELRRLAAVLRVAVARAGVAEEDEGVADLHLGVADDAARLDIAEPLAKAERVGQPGERRADIF